MFKDDYTIIAVISAVAGCLIRYLNDYKKGSNVKLSFLLGDAITSAFIGYLAYWIISEEHLLKPSYSAVVCCVIGNLGSKVFDLIAWYAHNRYGIPNLKYQKEENKNER